MPLCPVCRENELKVADSICASCKKPTRIRVVFRGDDLQEFSNLDDAVLGLVGLLGVNDFAELTFNTNDSTTLESIESALAAQEVRHDATLVRKRVGDDLVLSLERPGFRSA
jgi:hypothetical protein